MIEIDLIAKRYSKLPSEIKQLNIQDLEFNILIMSHGLNEEYKLAKKAEMKNKAKTKGKRYGR